MHQMGALPDHRVRAVCSSGRCPRCWLSPEFKGSPQRVQGVIILPSRRCLAVLQPLLHLREALGQC